MAYGRYSIHTVLNHFTITKFKQNNWHSSDGAEIHYDPFDCGSHFKERNMKMKKIRVSWEYPDIYTRPDDPYMHEDFEVDDDATILTLKFLTNEAKKEFLKETQKEHENE